MDEEIRPPDQPIRDCLLPHNTYESEEDQLRRALEESETDFELQHAIILSRRAQEEKEERTKHVAYFKSRFMQFMQIDRPNKEFYSDMIRYVEKYESGDLSSVSIGEEYYVKFRRTLDNMRITPVDKTKILEIIIQ
jgi:hypothetical protein